MNKQLKLKQIAFLLIFLFCCIGIYAQEQSVTIKLEKASLIDVFSAIEKQTTYRFSYRDVVIDSKKDITVYKTNALVSTVLNEVLGAKGLNYSIVSSKSIVISDKQQTESKTTGGTKQITGTVLDSNGVSLVGVSVSIKGTSIGTVTDHDGNFLLDVPVNSVVTISYVGYLPQSLKITETKKINVVLEEDMKVLEEIIVVGYGTQKKGNLTGSIASINSKEITNTTHSSLAQSLQGKVSGLQIRQNSGAPGEFDTNINIRGFGAPLYVIDGVPSGGGSEFQRLDPNDIESISVLKDASAAIYGLNAGNGVILVTTKKGQSGRPKFSYSGTFGVQAVTDAPKMTSAAQWKELYNEAQVNNGSAPTTSKEEMEKWKSGAPGYESTDWYDLIIRDYAPQTQHNLSVRGGSEAVNYYVSLGYYKEEGLLKSKDLNYDRYNIRSNVTAKLANNLTADVMLSGRYDERTSPGDFFWIYSGVFNSLSSERPYANNNPDYYARNTGENPLPMMYEDIVGYNKSKNKQFLTIASITYKAPFLKGLEFKGSFSYDTFVKEGDNLQKSYNIYSYNVEKDTYDPTVKNSPSKISNSNESNNKVMLQAQASYNNTFAEKHNVSGTLVYEQMQGNYRYNWLQREYDFFTGDQVNLASTNNQGTDGKTSEEASLSVIGKFSYNYMGKYLLDFAFRQDGTYRYASHNKWGFFPVISGGWRVSEESFFKNKLHFLSNLKFRASYGKVGENAGSPFQYVEGYTSTNAGGYEMTDGSFTTGITAPSITNKDLTWYTSTITDIGFDLGLFNNKLNIEFDVYQRDKKGLLAKRNLSLPNTFGATLPDENLNSERVRGIELMVAHRNKIGDVSFGISGNVNFARNMRLYVERAKFTSSYDRWRNGTSDRWSDIVWGYNNIGQFQSIEQLLNSPLQAGSNGNSLELPGGFMYEDTNGDGLIDGKDMMPSLWDGSPKIHYGLTLDAQWKGFDFNALLQGSAKYTIRFNGTFIRVLNGGTNTPEFFSDRWHLADPYNPETSEWIAGKWPATRQPQYNTITNFESSAIRKDASYVRLKNIEIGYTIPSRILKKVNLESCRLFVNAHNVFTLCDSYLKVFDPEKVEGAYTSGMGYPLTKSYNIGVNLTF